MTRHLVLSIAASCVAVGVAGCGKDSAPSVHGKVTLDGESVVNGNIQFLPQVKSGQGKSGSKAAAAIEQGAYAISPQDKLQPGTYRVVISWLKPTGRKIPSADPGITIDETREAVPAKYNTESTLTAEIGSGDVEKDFSLSSN